MIFNLLIHNLKIVIGLQLLPLCLILCSSEGVAVVESDNDPMSSSPQTGVQLCYF